MTKLKRTTIRFPSADSQSSRRRNFDVFRSRIYSPERFHRSRRTDSNSSHCYVTRFPPGPFLPRDFVQMQRVELPRPKKKKSTIQFPTNRRVFSDTIAEWRSSFVHRKANDLHGLRTEYLSSSLSLSFSLLRSRSLPRARGGPKKGRHETSV